MNDISSLVKIDVSQELDEIAFYKEATKYLENKNDINEVTDPRFYEFIQHTWTSFSTELQQIIHEFSLYDELQEKMLRLLNTSRIFDSSDIFPNLSITKPEAKREIIKVCTSNAIPGLLLLDKDLFRKLSEKLKRIDDDELIKYGKLARYQQAIFTNIQKTQNKLNATYCGVQICYRRDAKYGLKPSVARLIKKVEDAKDRALPMLATLLHKSARNRVELLDIIIYIEVHDIPLGNGNTVPETIPKEVEEDIERVWKEHHLPEASLIVERDDKTNFYEIRLPLLITKEKLSEYTEKIDKKFGKKIVMDYGIREEDKVPWIILNNKEAAETAHKWFSSLHKGMPFSYEVPKEFKAILVNVPTETSMAQIKDMLTKSEGDEITLKNDPVLLDSETIDGNSTNKILVTFQCKEDYISAKKGLEPLDMVGIKIEPYSEYAP